MIIIISIKKYSQIITNWLISNVYRLKNGRFCASCNRSDGCLSYSALYQFQFNSLVHISTCEGESNELDHKHYIWFQFHILKYLFSGSYKIAVFVQWLQQLKYDNFFLFTRSHWNMIRLWYANLLSFCAFRFGREFQCEHIHDRPCQTYYGYWKINFQSVAIKLSN